MIFKSLPFAANGKIFLLLGGIILWCGCATPALQESSDLITEPLGPQSSSEQENSSKVLLKQEKTVDTNKAPPSIPHSPAKTDQPVQEPMKKAAQSTEEGLPPPEPVMDQEEKKNIFSRGVNLLSNKGEHHRDKAEEIFLALVKADSSYWQAHYYLAYIAFQRGDLAKAEGELVKAQEIKGESAEINNLLGTLHFKKGEKERAIATYQRNLNLKRELKNTHSLLGNLYMFHKEWKKAVAHYNKTGKFDQERYHIFLNKGSCYLQLEKWEEALSSFKTLYDGGIKEEYFLKQYAFALKKQGEIKQAVNLYKELLYRFPETDPEVYKNLAILNEIYLNNPKKAIKHYQTYLVKGGKEKSTVEEWIKNLKNLTK